MANKSHLLQGWLRCPEVTSGGGRPYPWQGGRLNNRSSSGAEGPLRPGAVKESRSRHPAYLMERTALFLCHGPKHWLDEFGSAESVRDILKGEDGGKKKNILPVSLEGTVFPAPFSLKS